MTIPTSAQVPKLAPSDLTFWQGLQDFFFRPSEPETLAVIRMATGLMVAYIHLVWILDLEAFMGPNALVDNDAWRTLHQGQDADYKWTYLAATESMALIWVHESLALVAGLLMAAGVLTRFSSTLAWFLTLMTAHRMTGLLFGLDQITIMLAMYLCLSRCGSVWSADAWLWNRYHDWIARQPWVRWLMGLVSLDGSTMSTCCWSNTLATRLMQMHLCVVYLFGGIGKMRGEMWWDGSAMWYSVASYEYQSLDMTWIGYFPFFSSIATHVTVFWELGYCALIWPRWTRPWFLGIAVMVHGGIALFLGMITFGTMMIIANLAFVPAALLRKLRR
jgi:hypothetical protein